MKKNGENERYFKKIARIYREDKKMSKIKSFTSVAAAGIMALSVCSSYIFSPYAGETVYAGQ